MIAELNQFQIQGHRSEIINDVDELLHYIEGTTDNMKSRTIQSKSKQVHKQHPPEDGGSRVGKKKQFKSVSKDSDSNLEAESRHELKVAQQVPNKCNLINIGCLCRKAIL